MRLVILFALATGCTEYDLGEMDDVVQPPMGPQLASPGDDDSSDSNTGSTSSSGPGRLVIALNQLKPGGTDEISYTGVEDLPGFQTGTGSDGSGGTSGTGTGTIPGTSSNGLGVTSVDTIEEPHVSDNSFSVTPIGGGGAGADQVDMSTSVGTQIVPGSADDLEPDVQAPPIDWWEEPWQEPPQGVPVPGDDGILGNEDPDDYTPSWDDEDDDGWGDTPEQGGWENENEGHDHSHTRRMTGGGHVTDQYGSWDESFTMRCEWTEGQNQQMNFNLYPLGHFHIDEVEWISCVNDPDVDPQEPTADFDTMVGVVTGHLGDEDARLWFLFTDNGEPGDTDYSQFEMEVGGDVLSGEGFLTEGNHQAH